MKLMTLQESVSKAIGERLCAVDSLATRARELESLVECRERPEELHRLAGELRALTRRIKTIRYEIESLRFFLNRSPHGDGT